MNKSFNKKRITNKSSKYNKHKHKYSGGFPKKVNYFGILTQLISNKFTYLDSVKALIKSKGELSIANKLLTNKTFYIDPEYIKYNNIFQQLIDMDFPFHIAFPALLISNWNVSNAVELILDERVKPMTPMNSNSINTLRRMGFLLLDSWLVLLDTGGSIEKARNILMNQSKLINNYNQLIEMGFLQADIERVLTFTKDIHRAIEILTVSKTHNYANKPQPNLLKSISRKAPPVFKYQPQFMKLVDMGFSKIDAEKALLQTNGNFDMAIEILISNQLPKTTLPTRTRIPPPPQAVVPRIRIPPPPQAVVPLIPPPPQAVVPRIPPPPQAVVPRIRIPPPPQAVVPRIRIPPYTPPHQQQLTQLLEMGYIKPDAEKALMDTNGNLDMAIELLIQRQQPISTLSRLKSKRRSSSYSRPRSMRRIIGKYFEHQNSMASCGRHALNHLLGGSYFTFSRISNNQYNVLDLNRPPLEYPVNLQQFCYTMNYYLSTIIEGNDEFVCLDYENYNESLLRAALCLFNYRMDGTYLSYHKMLEHIRFHNEWKLLVNESGSPQGGHWVAICKYVGDNNIYYFNSLRQNVEIYSSIRDFENRYNRYSGQYYVVEPYRTKTYKNPFVTLYQGPLVYNRYVD